MEKIFVVDTSDAGEGCSGRLSKEGGEKEEGEVGDHGEGEGERFKFWVRVDLTKAADMTSNC